MIDHNIVPKSWEKMELGVVCKIRNGYAFKSKDFQESGVLLFRQTNIDGENVKLKDAVYLPEEYLIRYKEFIIEKGDILIGMSGSIGKICVYNLDKPALQNQRTGLLQFESAVEKKFVRYYIEVLEQEFVKKSKGIAVLNISGKDIQESIFYLPPLAEQHRIVAKIEELFSSLDKGIESLKTAQQQLKVYRQSVLKWAFEGKLTNTQGIKWLKLGEFCDDVEYGSAAKSKKQGKIPVLRMGNIQGGRIDWSDLVYTDNIDEIEKYSLVEGDVLFNRTNSSELVGKTAIYKAEKPAIFAGYLIRIKYEKDKIDPNYLNYYLNSHTAKKYGNSVKTFGVNQANINGTKLKGYPFPYIIISEQHRIVAAIESRLSVCDKIEESIEESLRQAQALRQSILKKAFEGKLVAQDPNDLPASTLLARIKAEREKNKKKNK